MTYGESGKLNIAVAVYGLETVTAKVQALVKKGNIETLELNVTNDAIGLDGWRGQIKSLTVVYNYDGGPLHVACAKEGESLLINQDTLNDGTEAGTRYAHEQGLSLLAATYGPQNITEKILSLLRPDNTLSFSVDNSTLGDTWYGVAKTLILVLGYTNVVTDIKIFAEREYCEISFSETVPVS